MSDTPHIAEERCPIPPYTPECMECNDAVPCRILREVCGCVCHKPAKDE
jgi:hypothetical protein